MSFWLNSIYFLKRLRKFHEIIFLYGQKIIVLIGDKRLNILKTRAVF